MLRLSRVKYKLLILLDKLMRLRRPVLPTTMNTGYVEGMRHSDMKTSGANERLKTLLWMMMFIFGSIIYGSYTVLVHLCEVDGKIPFSSSSMVMMIETCKISISILLYIPEVCKNGLILPPFKFCLPFAVPACLYCFNNNIAVHMQLHMDPATYQVLSNLKIVTTAVLYRLIIKRVLSMTQWCALGLLTLAGVCNSYAGLQSKTGSGNGEIHISMMGMLMMLSYCIISGLAGVYTEYILKQQYQYSLNVQNILLYTFGISLNGGVWFANTSRTEGLSDGKGFFYGYNAYTWVIILTQAFNGLIMSAVMKHSSNITRLFIISSAMLVTTVLAIFIFNLKLNFFFISAFILVTTALYMYYNV